MDILINVAVTITILSAASILISRTVIEEAPDWYYAMIMTFLMFTVVMDIVVAVMWVWS